jgi:hypothetical protein
MSLIAFYIDVVRALDEINAPYMIVGAFAGSTYGVARTTYDVDIIVGLRESDLGPCRSFSIASFSPRYDQAPAEVTKNPSPPFW